MKRLVAFILLSAALHSPIPASADAVSSSEYQLKAAFLYNFAKFVEWPPEANEQNKDTFVIGIYGRDPFGVDIDELLANKTVNDKKIVIKRFRSVDTLEPCHILFIDPARTHELDAIMRRLEGTSVLTVSDHRDFTAQGGMIGFVMEDNKIRFEINKQAADKWGLKLSAQLLKLAKSVIS